MTITDIPEFFRDHNPGRGLKRITAISRPPATGYYGDAWHTAAARFPDQRIALQRPADIAPEAGTGYTYSQWADQVSEIAACLFETGVRPWDRVAVMKANHPDVQVIGSAVARLGAVPFQLAWNHDHDVATTLLQRLDRPFLVTDHGRLAQAELSPEELRTLTTRTIVVGRDPAPEGTVHLDDLRGANPAPVRLRGWSEPMVATHTSGTTGYPKFALHSAETLHAVAHVETEHWGGLGFRNSDVFAFFDPYFHQHTITALLTLATVGPRFVAISDVLEPNVADLLAADKPTVVDMPPNMYLVLEHLASDPRDLFEKVRFYISSFDAVHTRSIRTFLAASKFTLPGWMQSWSQTEQGTIVLRPYLKFMVRKVGQFPPPSQNMGWPLPTVAKLRAVDPETGVEVPRGQVGLIEIDHPGRCLAYIGEQHRHTNKADGTCWNTGDLGIISRWGTVRLIDREIDRIEGGSGIAIEDALLDRLPETSEVVILPRAAALPAPVYSTYSGEPVPAERWAAATAGLPTLAGPIHLPWNDFPRTATWKIRRVELRRRLSDEAPTGIGAWT
ncbi:AMP-binding protein [Nocardia crassostreae]|uniref:AMP-binding protein n=1 Tax=Nocardia crassostreae TaxID=53428 RepID=UPI000832023F|nr:class I adenylate-forming enzyme family protein [Nocardia crassostreae]